MRIIVRGMAVGATLFALFGLGALVATASAQTPAKPLNAQLIGHWRLVSVSINGNAPYGPNPQGSMFIDAGGQYGVIVITAGPARSISYFGSYTIDDAAKSITMHVDASTAAGAAGRDVKRLVSLDGDELIMHNETTAGVPGPIQLTWQRSK